MKVLYLLLVLAPMIATDNCPNVKEVDFLDINKLVGDWYIQWFCSFYEAVWLKGFYGNCMHQRWIKFDDSNMLCYHFQENMQNKVFEKRRMVASFKDPERRNGVVRVTIYTSSGGHEITYKILAVKYNSYIIIYSCDHFLNMFKAESGYVMTRKANMTAEEEKSMMKVIENTAQNCGGPSPDQYKRRLQNCSTCEKFDAYSDN